MIKYHVCKDQTITEIKISGHANYDQHGQDIVCAAVSTASILTYNALEKLGFKSDLILDIKDGYFHLKVKKSNKTLAALLENLEDSLTQLEQQYPKYIKHQKEG